MVQTIFPNARVEPELTVPDSVRGKTWEHANAIREMVRGRMEVCGPITVDELSDILILPASDIDAALLALEAEGFVFAR
jgi:ATP-dependent Lhr-like helicase